MDSVQVDTGLVVVKILIFLVTFAFIIFIIYVPIKLIRNSNKNTKILHDIEVHLRSIKEKPDRS